MKMSRKTRIIGLSAILAVLLVGAGVLSWKLLAPETDVPDAPTVEGVAEQIYTETTIATNSDYRIQDIAWYGSELVARVNRDIIAVATQEKVCEIPPELEEQHPGSIQQTAFDKSKNLYVSKIAPDNKMVVLKHSADPAEPDSEIIMDGWKAFAVPGYTPELRGLCVDENYLYLLSSLDSRAYNLQIFTHDGKLFSEYPLITAFEIDDNGALYVATMTNAIQKHDVATKEMIYFKPLNIKDGSSLISKIALEKNSGLLYISNTISVQTYNESDGEFTKVAMTLAESAPSWARTNRSLQVDDDQSIYTVSYEGEKSTLLKYSSGDDSRRDMEHTLTITAPYKDDFIERAITLFEQKNPTQKVKYDYTYNNFASFDENCKDDGYEDKINLRLMAGDIGDIVMVGDPWIGKQSALTGDMFIDLKEKIKKDESYKSLDHAALDAITVDGAIRGVPVRTNYYYAAVNMTMCREMGIELDWNNATWSDVLALNEKFKGTDKYLFDMYNQERIFTRMLISNMPDIMNIENGKIDLRAPWFLDLVEQWNEASRSKSFAKINKKYGITDDALICLDGKTSIKPESGVVYDYIDSNMSGNKDVRYLPLFCGEKNSNRTAESEQMYAISGRSKNQESAWEFISFLLRTNVSGDHETLGRSINKEVRSEEFQTTTTKSKNAELADRYLEDMENVYNSVDTLYDMGLFKEDLFKPLLKYFSGQITLDEALKQAEHDIWIRMNE